MLSSSKLSPSQPATERPQYHSVLGLFDDYEQHQHNMQLRGDSTFAGPTPIRSYTNKLFSSSFLIFTVAFAGFCSLVVLNGDLGRLKHGTDLRGEVCGQGKLESRRFLFYPELLDWTLCVEACPYYFIERYYCIYDPADYSEVEPDWGCWDAYETTALSFYCLPEDSPARERVLEHLFTPLAQLRRAFADVLLAWDSVLLGVGAGTCLSFSQMLLLSRQPSLHLLVRVNYFVLVVVSGVLVYSLFGALAETREEVCKNLTGNCVYSQAWAYFTVIGGLGFLVSYYTYRILRHTYSLQASSEALSLVRKPLKAHRCSRYPVHYTNTASRITSVENMLSMLNAKI